MDAATGEPLAGIRVRALGSPGSAEAVSLADGSFVLRGLAEGPIEMEARPADAIRASADYLREYLECAAGGADEVVLRMRRGRSIAGRVLRDDGTPVAAAVRVALPSGPGEASRRRDMDATRTRSAEDGTFTLHGLPEGLYTVSAEQGGGYAPAEVRGVPAGTSDLVVVLAIGAPVSGRVVGADGLAPGGGFVFWVPPGEEVRWYTARERMALEDEAVDSKCAGVEADGSFRTEGLARGTLVDLVAVGFPGSVPTRLRGVAAGTQEVLLRLDEGRLLSGIVVDPAGAPVGAGVPVYADREGEARPFAAGIAALALTDTDGRFVLRGLLEGGFRLAAGGGDSPWRPTTLEGTVAAGTTDLRVVVQPGEVLSGTVRDGEGRPMADCLLWAVPDPEPLRTGNMFTRMVLGMRCSSSPGTPVAATDEEGRFRFTGLAEGEVRLRLQRLLPDGGVAPAGALRPDRVRVPGTDVVVTSEPE